MATEGDKPKRWSTWTIEIKVWKILAALIILPILVMWFKVVHQNDEILLLVRNDVVTDAAGRRSWAGSFVNTNSRTLRDVAVTVDFLDSGDRTVAKAEAEAAELTYGTRLDLQAPLPSDAVRLRILFGAVAHGPDCRRPMVTEGFGIGADGAFPRTL
jgi:hypothetical protein